MKLLGTLVAGLLLGLGSPVWASSTTAGETAAGVMSSPMSNFSNEAQTAKNDLGITSQDYSGVYGGTAGSKGTFTANGNIQCIAGQQRYIGGVGVLINGCTTSGTSVSSINVGLCNNVRDKGLPCTASDYTQTGSATPGTPLTLGSDTITFTCTGLDCGVQITLQRSMSLTGPSISAQAQSAASAVGSSGLVNQLSTVISSQALQTDVTSEAQIGTCYNNQVSSLNSTGNISNCAGTYTLQMYNPTTGLSNLCSNSSGGVSWLQSCTQSQSINVSNCHSSLECVTTQNTTQVSCQTGTLQQLVINPSTCGPVETLTNNLFNYFWLLDNYLFYTTDGTIYDTFWGSTASGVPSSVVTYLQSVISDWGTTAGYWTLNHPYTLYVNGTYQGVVSYLATSIFSSTYGLYSAAPFDFINYAPSTFSTYLYTLPYVNTAGLNALVYGGSSFQLCSGNCSSISVQTTASGTTYVCSATTGPSGGGTCPSGFTLSGGLCYQNVPITSSCSYTGSVPVSVTGAVSGEIRNYNCDTCSTYQALAP
ncbi:hypothetical protein [Acidihalobacter aeolianus]|uniref:hypothetical protein n=1 Tax=Acidihalobacter aeolianus TaxID=2792603 RepID=UPI0012E9F16F|nr:hypothetical protein [Acidihalobacter aeolianus]